MQPWIFMVNFLKSGIMYWNIHTYKVFHTAVLRPLPPQAIVLICQSSVGKNSSQRFVLILLVHRNIEITFILFSKRSFTMLTSHFLKPFLPLIWWHALHGLFVPSECFISTKVSQWTVHFWRDGHGLPFFITNT